METKVCTKCGLEMSVAKFGKRIDKRGPYTYYRSVCKKCKKLEDYKYKKTPSGKKYCQRASAIRYKKYSQKIKKRLAEYHKTENGKSSIARGSKKKVALITDSYVAGLLKKYYNISLLTIYADTELINSFRQQIKVKRLLKSKKNGQKSLKTS